MIARSDVRWMVLRYPRLLSQRTQTFERNLEALSRATGLERGQINEAAVKMPPLLYLEAGRVVAKLHKAAGLLSAPFPAVLQAFARMPMLAGRDPVGLARRVRICVRMASALGQTATAAEVFELCPAAPTYSTERLLLRYLVARLGLWEGAWTTLVTKLPPTRIESMLRAHLQSLPEASREAERLSILLARRLREE